MMVYTAENFLYRKNCFCYSSSMNDGEFINDIALFNAFVYNMIHSLYEYPSCE